MRENQIAFPCGLMPFHNDIYDECHYRYTWGYINNKGVVAIKPQFEYATNFAECGLASVTSNGKKGYIDINGEFAIPPQFQFAFKFRANNLAHVCKDGEDFYIDMQGNRVSECDDDEENESVLRLKEIEKDGKSGAINDKGEIVITPLFDKVWANSEGTPVMVSLDKKKGYIDLQGNIVIELKYDYKDAMTFDSCGLAAVAVNDKWGFIDQKGDFVVSPQFDNVYSFRNGFAPVILNHKWGYIDSKGKLVISPQFNSGSGFYKDGLAIVWIDKKCGYINTSGTFVIKPEYTDANGFQNGLAAVKKGRKCGYINQNGEIVIPLQFSNAGGFSKDGYAVVRIKEGYGLIDRVGEWVIAPHCGGLNTSDFFE